MTIISGGNGSDTLTGTSGTDIISGGNGQDTLDGGAGSDILIGGNGDDSLFGSGDNDALIGGNGDDLLDGGAGTDAVFGESGNDTAAYVVSENAGQCDFYDGGNGVDTLRLILTQSQADSAAVQADIQAYLAFLALYANGGSTSGPIFQFTAFNLTVRNFEQLDVVVIPGGNLAPTDIDLSNTAVAENSASGTVVGALTASDPDVGDILTFALLDDAGGRFAIDGNNLVVAGSLDFETATSHQVTVRVTDAGGASYDEVFTITVDNVSGSIVGDNANNVLIGTSEEDTIQGLDGNDQIRGGAGNDLLVGGPGNDRAVYTDATGSVTINLAAGTASGAGVGFDTLQAIESISGSSFADTFNAGGFSGLSTNAGSNGTANLFEGMGGNDTIIGNGNTRISFQSATGGVTVDMAAGTATGDASVGTDTFGGVNSARGSNSDDVFLGGNANERFEGLGGDDFINGGGGSNDTAAYGDLPGSQSSINVNLAAGIVTGATTGTDTLRSIEIVSGSEFDDVFDATGFSGTSLNAGSNGTFNQFEGLAGNDTIIGNGFTVASYLGATAGVTVDLVAGIATGNTSVGTDTLTDVTRIQGSNFGDTLIGNGASNIIAGRGGNDFIDGGANTGGGSGAGDRADYRAATAGINVQLANGVVTGDGSVGTDTLNSMEGIIGSNFADTYNAVGFSSSSLNAGSVVFHFFMTNGEFNQFEGMGGDDTITGNGSTELNFFSATGGVTVDLTTGIATGNASVGTDTFTGVNAVNASAFNDTLTGDANRNVLEGRDGNDVLAGGGGDDILRGDGPTTPVHGNDILIGGTGNDLLTGYGGDDTFVFADGDGADTITDFVAGAGTDDVIDLTGVSGVHTLGDVMAIATDDGTHTTVNFGGGNTIVLQNVLVAQLHQDDFLFV